MHRFIRVLNGTTMNSKGKKGWKGSAIFIVLLFLLFFRIPVIEIAGENQTLYIKEKEFKIGWIHSVEKEEWFEIYERRKNELVLTDTYFKTFGAGTPYFEKTVVTENGFVRMKIDQHFPSLTITVSENVKTSVFIEDRQIPLYEYFADYETVTIRIDYLPIWRYMGVTFI